MMLKIPDLLERVIRMLSVLTIDTIVAGCERICKLSNGVLVTKFRFQSKPGITNMVCILSLCDE